MPYIKSSGFTIKKIRRFSLQLKQSNKMPLTIYSSFCARKVNRIILENNDNSKGIDDKLSDFFAGRMPKCVQFHNWFRLVTIRKTRLPQRNRLKFSALLFNKNCFICFTSEISEHCTDCVPSFPSFLL